MKLFALLFSVTILLVGCGADSSDTIGNYLNKNGLISDPKRITLIHRSHQLQDNKFLVRTPRSNCRFHDLPVGKRPRAVSLTAPETPGSDEHYDPYEAERLTKLLKEHSPSDFHVDKVTVSYLRPASRDSGVYVFETQANVDVLIQVSFD